MYIRVRELCEWYDFKNKRTRQNGVRTYVYHADADNIYDAIHEIRYSFDSDNVVEDYDDFDGSCQDSEVIGFEVAEGYED